MIPTDGKKLRGEDYPATIVVDGVHVPLQHESRFKRIYHSVERNTSYGQSRFLDGSASITASELERDWATWTEDLQIDFCQNCLYLFGQSDFREMLRFIMQHGSSKHWAAIALTVAYRLPQQETFDFLIRALRATTDIASAANMTQGIAETKHPDAEAVLRDHLADIWMQPALWENSSSGINWIAYNATTCIDYLIKLGAPAADFAGHARRLSQHVCSLNRDSWKRHLSKHYPEMTLHN